MADAPKEHTTISVAGPPSASARVVPQKGIPAEIPALVQTDGSAATGVHEGLLQYANLLDRLSEGEIHELRDAFKSADKDNSGFLELKELKNVLASLGSELTDPEFQDFARMVDQDADGKVDFEEFLIMMAVKLAYPFSEAEVVATFQVLDEDHNGLDLEELKKEFLTTLESDDVNKALSEAFYKEAQQFLSGDGKVDYERFARHITTATFVDDK